MKESEFVFQFSDGPVRGDEMTREQLFRVIEAMVNEITFAGMLNEQHNKTLSGTTH